MAFTLYWIRPDGQGDYSMGTYASEAEAEAAIAGAEAELIEQCPGPRIETNEDFTRCRDEILAGSWSIQNEDA
jgi:hypothetical protein